MTYTDKHTGKVYHISDDHFYGRKVTQFPAGTSAWDARDGERSRKATSTVTFATQAQRTSWLRMMGFIA